MKRSKNQDMSAAERAQSEGPKHLSLNLHSKYFLAILCGTKKREYRADTVYWRKRLLGRTYSEVHFRNGYSPNAPFLRVQVLGISRNPKKREFVIKLGRILQKKYLRK